MSEKKIPHVHAECIKAWADGAKIQFRMKGSSINWVDLNGDPGWSTKCDYRVKPEPKPDRIAFAMLFVSLASRTNNTVGQRVTCPYTEQGNNIKLTFDGETGKLKSAEAL